VEAAGLVFLGPRPGTLAAVGDKKSARETARRAGVPITPGWEGEALDEAGRPTREALAAAEAIGYPLLLKAVMGGGGKGMREVRSGDELGDALAATAREARSSFGDAALYMEKRLDPVRHIEVQFVGDGEGGVAHLLERECSLQRRHQKVIEESPGARMDEALRSRLTASARAIAAATRYRGAGTAEFLVDAAGGHYFLEVNARIQVEHPVTELVTGTDLVALQLDVALGRGLPAGLEPAAPYGHAIEARLYAEDPAHDFLPQSGRIAALRLPGGAGIRVDAGVREGDEVGLHFDPMIAKITAWAPTRDAALDRLAAALAETAVAGVPTNLGFLRALLAHPAVRAGELATSLIEREIAPAWRTARRERPLDDAALAAAALAASEGAAALRRGGAGAAAAEGAGTGAAGGAANGGAATPWDTLADFRLGARPGTGAATGGA
jgi:acetyl-CoA/propionyl-CoA carboxylase biotin carboxyl carrier protein